MEVDHVSERTPRWGLGDAAVGLLVGWVATAVVVSLWVSAGGGQPPNEQADSSVAQPPARCALAEVLDVHRTPTIGSDGV